MIAGVRPSPIFARMIGRRGELGQAFAQPLVAVAVPGDGLSPPLMGDFVGEEVFAVARRGRPGCRDWGRHGRRGSAAAR